MKKSHILVLSLLFTSIFISSCNDDSDTSTIEEIDCDTYVWEYEGDTDTSDWASCYSDCSGESQSPIDITEAVIDSSLTTLETDYEEVPIELTYNGYTIEFEYEEGSALELNGEEFELLQFHFHTSSEHTVDGYQYPMEAHLVHQNEDSGDLAVIGIFFEEGNENAFLANFIDNLPSVTDEVYSSESLINVEDLLPEAESYYTYSGSLTTPPCSEIATWLVLKTPVEASSTQIESIHEIINDNFRPTQSLNGREITEFN